MTERMGRTMHRLADEGHPSATASIRYPQWTLFALALGTFAIGTGEFGSNGVIQLFPAAFGVVIGSPAITLLVARVNWRSGCVLRRQGRGRRLRVRADLLIRR